MFSLLIKKYQKKLKDVKSQNGVPALAIYVAIIFFVFGIWTLGYQTIMWIKTNEWLNLPWYQTIFKSEPVVFQYLASISLSLLFIIITPITYFILKALLPVNSLDAEVSHLENIVSKLEDKIK